MTNSDVTLLGATGFVGRRILRDLNEQGVKVQAVSRRPRPAELSAGITWTQVDLNDPARIAEIHWSETVISTVLISMTAQVSELWPPDPSRRLIAFSSTSALTKSESSESADRATSALLHDGEARVRALHPNTTILRPTMIYGGPGDRNVERVAMQLRKFPIFPLVGKGAGLRQPVHADDLATAAILAAKSSMAVGKTYNLAGSETLTFKEMIQRIGESNKSSVRFFSIPLPIARATLRLLSPLPRFKGIPLGSLERMLQDLTFDTHHATEDFGFSSRAFTPIGY